MDIEIEIETDDARLLSDLLEEPSSSVQLGYHKVLTNGATITLKDHVRRRAIGIPPETIALVLTLGTSIATNIISTWLYETLKRRAAKLHIARKEVPVDKEAIQRIVAESIQSQERE